MDELQLAVLHDYVMEYLPDAQRLRQEQAEISADTLDIYELYEVNFEDNNCAGNKYIDASSYLSKLLLIAENIICRPEASAIKKAAAKLLLLITSYELLNPRYSANKIMKTLSGGHCTRESLLDDIHTALLELNDITGRNVKFERLFLKQIEHSELIKESNSATDTTVINPLEKEVVKSVESEVVKPETVTVKPEEANTIKPEKTDVAKQFQKYSDLKASEISIVVMENHTMKVVLKKATLSVDPSELDINIDSNEWKLMQSAAVNNGRLDEGLKKLNKSSDLEREKNKIKKIISRLRTKLKNKMGLIDEPIRYSKGDSYSFTFKLMTHELLHGGNVKARDAMDYLQTGYDENEHGSYEDEYYEEGEDNSFWKDE